jgi:hypothetical protein
MISSARTSDSLRWGRIAVILLLVTAGATQKPLPERAITPGSDAHERPFVSAAFDPVAVFGAAGGRTRAPLYFRILPLSGPGTLALVLTGLVLLVCSVRRRSRPSLTPIDPGHRPPAVARPTDLPRRRVTASETPPKYHSVLRSNGRHD